MAAAAALLAAALAAAACTRESVAPMPTAISAEAAPLPDEITSVAVSERPWTFGTIPGRILETAHFRIHTTLDRSWVDETMPLFLERALAQYTTAIAHLPPPRSVLETYLFARRGEWEQKTRQMLSADADRYLQLGRGGFTTRGISVLYYIGPRGRRDTLAIAAHEGWHQYSQGTFRHPLPVWLEEGIATYMEGFVSHPDGLPKFRPWANLERYQALRDAVRRERVIPLERLVGLRPDSLLDGDGSGESLLRYYAQVWALVHFLVEGEDGRHRPALQQVLLDAVGGRGNRGNKLAGTGRDGRAVLASYFGADVALMGRQYLEFVGQVVRTGGREQIVRGDRPFE